MLSGVWTAKAVFMRCPVEVRTLLGTRLEAIMLHSGKVLVLDFVEETSLSDGRNLRHSGNGMGIAGWF